MTDNWERRFEQRPARTTFSAGVLILLGLMGLTIVGGIGFWTIGIVSQPGRVLAKTLDADNVIYNYEWFRQQYQDVLAMDAKIAVQDAAATAATGDEKTRVFSIVAGLKTKRAQMVADYNARGSMANRSIFTAGLPQQIN